MRIIQIVAFFILPVAAVAQKSGIATYRISYGYCNLVDYKAALHFNGSQSFFETTAGPNNTFSLVLHDTLTSTPNRLKNTMANQSQVYTNLKERRLIASNQLLLTETYYTLEEPKTIKWEFHSNTKKIGKYLCHKATGRFRGRDYTAWFTKDIPVEFGPWKFNGLPGLIMEVVENNMHIHFILQTIEMPFEHKIPSLKAEKYLTVPEYLTKFKAEALALTPDHPSRHKPSVRTFIDISMFTELEKDIK